MPEIPSIAALFNSPPEAIIAQFRSKGYNISWNWRETWKEANARAFTVAKAMDLEVLESIRESVDFALAEGTTFENFRKDLEPILQEKGWWGRKEITDPETGEITEVQLGSPHRLKTIYRQNLSVSYAAGRYQAQIAAAERRPWWIYRDAGDQNVREKHHEWNGTVLRFDHPAWSWMYPPNDWGCRCGVDSLSDRQLETRGLEPYTGNVEPFAGEGWDYNPAKEAWQPNTDEVREADARLYVKAALDGPGLAQLYDRTNTLIKSLREQGLDDVKVLNAFRTRATREEFPVAILEAAYRQAISARAHTVIMSAESLAKNIIRHPEIRLADYRKLQAVYENAQLVVKNSDKTLQFYWQEIEKLFATVKATFNGEKLYLTSFRKASHDRVESIRKSGEVIKDEL